MWGYHAGPATPLAEVECVGRGRFPLTVTAAGGTWSAQLPAYPADVKCDVRVAADEEEISLTGVLWGDVWVCSGQSNMEQTMSNIMNSTEEIAASARYRSIRFMSVRNTVAAEADADADIELDFTWSDSASPNLASMSAVCFLFARSLQDFQGEQGGFVTPVPLGRENQIISRDVVITCIQDSSSEQNVSIFTEG